MHRSSGWNLQKICCKLDDGVSHAKSGNNWHRELGPHPSQIFFTRVASCSPCMKMMNAFLRISSRCTKSNWQQVERIMCTDQQKQDEDILALLRAQSSVLQRLHNTNAGKAELEQHMSLDKQTQPFQNYISRRNNSYQFCPSLTVLGSCSASAISAWRTKTFPRQARHSKRSKEAMRFRLMTPATELWAVRKMNISNKQWCQTAFAANICGCRTQTTK